MPRDIPRSTEVGATGPLNEIKTLHSNGSASLDELREFLGRLQGRSPQEMLGLVSSSRLVQSMTLSVVATAAFLAVFTLGPYFVFGPPVEKAKENPVATATAAAVAASQAAEAPAAEGKKTPEGENADPTAKAVKVLGLDETKDADPKSNPLEKNLDKLLDDLK
jgi:hypothetical protein